MNYFKLTNELDKITKKMEWILKEDVGYQIEIFPQSWNNSSGSKEDVGINVITTQTTYVVYNISLGNAFVFFDGVFSYKTEINNKFMEDLKLKSIAGMKSYWKRYDMETYKNNPEKYCHYIQNVK